MTSPAGWIAPMLATAGPVPTGDRWAYEVKHDGIRAIAAAGLRLRSRNDRALTDDYPELAGLELEPGLMLDGEIVALDGAGRSDFELLQQRIHHTHPSRKLQERVPVTLVVFDLLHRRGEPLLAQPYRERRTALHGLELDEHPRLQVPQHFTGITGERILELVGAQGLEGVVAKQLDSPYLPGRRSRSWIKTPIRHTALVAVIGWAPSSSSRRRLGALLLAVPDSDGALRYAGDVGTGFTQGAREELRDLLTGLERPDPPVPLSGPRSQRWRGSVPFSAVHWAEPGVIGEIAFRATTADGAFRHASWQGLRPRNRLSDLVPPESDAPGRRDGQ